MKHLSSLEPPIGEHFGECYLGRPLTFFSSEKLPTLPIVYLWVVWKMRPTLENMLYLYMLMRYTIRSLKAAALCQ